MDSRKSSQSSGDAAVGRDLQPIEPPAHPKRIHTLGMQLDEVCTSHERIMRYPECAENKGQR